VWLAERGWVRFDPTAAIAPGRIQNGLSESLPDNTALPFMLRDPPQWLRDLRFNFDAMANQWNQWVLGYDMERQFAFLTRLGMEDITWQRMAFNMLAGIFLLVGIFTLILLRRLIVKQHDMVQATWLKACRKLAKVGLPRLAHEGAQDYANRVSRTRPDLAQGIQDIATRYTALRYKSESKPDSLNDFKKSVKAFKV
jgi:hypothetical protein